MAKYIKTKSNYVLREQHQKVNDGTVYERDFMTVSDFGGMSPTEEQSYGINNFKFLVRYGLNSQKKHSNGAWLTEKDANKKPTVRKDGVKFNPDYESIADFAYYGSAVDMVRASIVDIILKFPAELYFSDDKFKGYVPESAFPAGKYEEYHTLVGDTPCVIANDYDIDIETEDIEDSEVSNPLRFLAKNIQDYLIYLPVGASGGTLFEACDASIEIEHYPVECMDLTSGAISSKVTIKYVESGTSKEIKIWVFRLENDKYLLTSAEYDGIRIRPKKEFVTEFYENLDDFEEVLLNRDSNPLYSATFLTPVEEETGNAEYREVYTWPSEHGWNPDLANAAYETYVARLIDLASYHDNYDSDNIWRAMTHEAIKNLDWTFTREHEEDVESFDKIDTTKIEPILKLYGRVYDDLKRSVDTIGRSTNVSYSKKDNVPDCFVRDILNESGWEVTSVNTIVGQNEVVVKYDGGDIVYNPDEIDYEFQRRLKINAPYLRSIKGTRKGIEAILGLLGLTKQDYSVKEYIAIAEGTGNSGITYPDYEKVVDINKQKGSFEPSANDPLFGLPLKAISLTTEDESGATTTNTYVVPWFDRGRKYDNDLYFQMKGGWGKTDRRKVNIPGTSAETTIESDSAFTIYDESISDLKFVSDLDDLLELGRQIVKTGDVCYVTDLTSLVERYNLSTGDTTDLSDASHYFYLENDEYALTLGYEKEAKSEPAYGWKCITNAELRATEPSTEVKRILYLESIKDDTTGNNPHMGHVSYDSGREYMETMFAPFKYTLDNGDFNMVDDSTIEEIKGLIFSGTYDDTVDNQKCWYFINDTNPGKLREITKRNEECDCGEISINDTRELTGVTITAITPYNPEGGNVNEEAAANSIINSKRLSVTFYIPEGIFASDQDKYRDFIRNKVLFYLRQMVPSTTLFEYKIENKA